jgi:hypothetical protein
MITPEPGSFYPLVVEGDGWCIRFQSKPGQGVTVTGRMPTLGEIRDMFSQSFPQLQMIVPAIVHVVMAEMHSHQAELKAAQDKVASLENDGVVGGQDVVALVSNERDEALVKLAEATRNLHGWVEEHRKARADADELKCQLRNTEDAAMRRAEATDREIRRMKELLSDARIAGERMSEALGSDECTIPWDDAVMPRLKEFR